MSRLGDSRRRTKLIVKKGTKPWSKINSHVNNMYFTLKSPRYVALSYRHGGWRTIAKLTGAVGKNLRSRVCSGFCTLLCQNREGRQEFAASKIKRLLVMLFEFSFADFTIFSRISEYCKYVRRLFQCCIRFQNTCPLDSLLWVYSWKHRDKLSCWDHLSVEVDYTSLQIIFCCKPVILYVRPGTRFDLTCSPFGQTKGE